jgi:hypothetical protein
MAMELAHHMMVSDWNYVWDYAGTSNRGFHIYVGLLYFLTGIHKTAAEALNAFLGFWGALALTRHFVRNVPNYILVPNSIFVVTFLPSALFWTSILIKEALMFWGICLFFTSVIPSGPKEKFKFGFSALIGLTVGIIMRPYTMVAWACSLAVVILYKSRRIMVSAVMVLGMIISVGFMASQLGIENVEEAEEFAKDWSQMTRNLQYEMPEGAESTITGKPIVFVSGAISLFFRPFPWNVRALRLVISSAEIWTISGLIILGWKRATRADRRLMLSSPDVLVSILVCLAYCMLFTFIANEGQVARARLQAMPALLTLAYVPYLLRYSRKVERKRMRAMYAQQAQYHPNAGLAFPTDNVAMSSRVSAATRDLTK